MSTRRHFTRTLLLAATVSLAGALSACSAPQVRDYARETPVLELSEFFQGTVDAYGVFTDRSGKVVKRFTVVMKCEWQGDDGVLDEVFSYSDGSTQRRVWRMKRHPGGRYTGQADDVVGTAEGQQSGNAFHWTYTLALPVDGRVINVDLNDWMYLMDDKLMLNRAQMSKWGVGLGELTLAFVRR